MAVAEIPAISAERVATLLPADLIRDDEVIILVLRPSLLYLVLSPLGTLMFLVIVTLALVIASVKFPAIAWDESQAYVFGAFLLSLRIGWQGLEWWSRVFVLTDKRVIRRVGIMHPEVHDEALADIMQTLVMIGFRERPFGLGTLGFATASSAAYTVSWEMIRHPLAVQRLVQETIEKYASPDSPEVA